MKSKINPGDYVVFRDGVDATIYLVVARTGFRIGVVQADHHSPATEWQDVSCAKHPTRAQMEYDKNDHW